MIYLHEVTEQRSFNWKQIILLVIGGIFLGLIALITVVKMPGMLE